MVVKWLTLCLNVYFCVNIKFDQNKYFLDKNIMHLNIFLHNIFQYKNEMQSTKFTN
jgi:hypothetical protein